MIELDYANMIEAGVHFGHQKKRWNPKFKTYLYKHLHGISIIDLERTRACLETAAKFLTECVKKGAHILFVGTKQQAQEVVREVAQAVEMPFCANRWLGGCLTNFETIKTSLAKYQRFLQMEESGELNKLPKKEGAVIRREMVRMQRSFEGIRNLTRRPDILVIVDARHEAIAIREAKRLQIPVVGIVDTNSDPTFIDFPIPANDDSAKSIRLILEYLQEAVAQGIELRKLERMSRKDVPVNVATNTKSWGRKDTVKATSKAARGEDESTQK
ncbi:MAG: 30S ribosomal protein S2 [Puniceicoccales bacterium]|nr:30S ribosomal protein S2 [Puniceicoccales bacterium]